MTPEQQRFAIAEACGWEHFTQFSNRITNPKGEAIFFDPLDQDKLELLPDYPNDLNAMNEAEKTLSTDQSNGPSEWDHYCMELCKLTGYSVVNHLKVIVHINPSQRAEAFLRTIGKWID